MATYCRHPYSRACAILLYQPAVRWVNSAEQRRSIFAEPRSKKCSTCESIPPNYQGERKAKKWTALQPEHGSIIILPDGYNVTHEHAILGKQDVGGDKTKKRLRISINTKHVREEDILYVERENREGAVIPQRCFTEILGNLGKSTARMVD
jgi:hypothetical protein